MSSAFEHEDLRMALKFPVIKDPVKDLGLS